MSLGVSNNYKIVTLSLYDENVITSPGYQYGYYEKNTNFTWDVRADDAAEEISIRLFIGLCSKMSF